MDVDTDMHHQSSYTDTLNKLTGSIFRECVVLEPCSKAPIGTILSFKCHQGYDVNWLAVTLTLLNLWLRLFQQSEPNGGIKYILGNFGGLKLYVKLYTSVIIHKSANIAQWIFPHNCTVS